MIDYKTAHLDSLDKTFLKTELRSRIALFLIILLGSLIVFSVGYIFVERLKFGGTNNRIVLTLYSLTSLTVYLYFLFKNLRGPYNDLMSDKKIIKYGIIQSKSKNTNYGWSGNIASDLKSQPKLAEYFIILDNLKYFVNENDYFQVEEGDKIELHISSSTNTLLRIEKSIQHGLR